MNRIQATKVLSSGDPEKSGIGKLVEKNGDLVYCQYSEGEFYYYSKEDYQDCPADSVFEILNFRAKKGIEILLENGFVQYESHEGFTFPQNALEFFPPGHLNKASQGFGEIVFETGWLDGWVLRSRPTGTRLGRVSWNDFIGLKNLIKQALDSEDTLATQVALICPEANLAWNSYRFDLKDLAANTTFDTKLETYLKTKSVQANSISHSPTIIESFTLSIFEYVEEEIKIGYGVFIYTPEESDLWTPRSIFSAEGENEPKLKDTYEELIEVVASAGYVFIPLGKYGRIRRGAPMRNGCYLGWNIIVNNLEAYEKHEVLFGEMLEYSTFPYYPTSESTIFHLSVRTDPFKDIRDAENRERYKAYSH